jgi:hypothetical protein
VEVIKDGKFIYTPQPGGETAQFDAADNTPAPASGQSWYYVRVMQKDRNMAWSSPIWVAWTRH